MLSSIETAGRGRLAWLVVGMLLLIPSWWAAVQPAALSVLAWQAETAWSEPWRLWSAAWVHLSALHWAANCAGAIGVVALGWVARVPYRAALSWALAWPLTHAALACVPTVHAYAGLSGVLHAGVAVVAVALIRRPAHTDARIGWAIGAGLALKVLLEAPWRSAVQHPVGWDIPVASAAHAAGAMVGALLAWALLSFRH